MKLILKESGYEDMLNAEPSKESEMRFENLMEFIGVAMEFEKESADNSLQDFLESIALVSDVDKLDESAEAVTLMTMHSAKGLEFNVVFLVGMEEGLFPSKKSIEEDEKCEEERRLCYVGITRNYVLLMYQKEHCLDQLLMQYLQDLFLRYQKNYLMKLQKIIFHLRKGNKKNSQIMNIVKQKK